MSALSSGTSSDRVDSVRAIGCWRVDFEYDPLYEGAFSDHETHSLFIAAYSAKEAGTLAAYQLSQRYGSPNVRISVAATSTEAEAERYAERLRQRLTNPENGTRLANYREALIAIRDEVGQFKSSVEACYFAMERARNALSANAEQPKRGASAQESANTQ